MTERNYYTYDLECYPNIFTFCGKFKNSKDIQLFEISDRKNQRNELLNFLGYLRNVQAEMVGFNNIGYDYPLIHEVITNPYTFDHNKAFQLSQTIIKGPGIKTIRPSDRYIAQIDLMRINHFNNKAKSTSLKNLQFAMRSDSLEDLPFDIRPLNDHEKNQLCKYNIHDVLETEKFLDHNLAAIEMRREYLANGTLRGDLLNFDDTKIGLKYLETRLGRNLCFSGRKPKQTFREVVHYNDVILPKIKFRTEPFNEIFNWFKQQKIRPAGGPRPSTEVSLAGLEVHCAAGGLHASADNKVYETNETHQIIDSDVSGMYPSIAIANRFAPEHLGETFLSAYKQIKIDRGRYAKGTTQNATLKLAANSAYGNSNNLYSFMYDPKFTFSVTINGQLQLLQLIEMVDLLPDCELIQANTDGITIYINKKYTYLYDLWCSEWEKMTGLELEHVKYNRMWIRDVNNYISEYEDGKLKSKGTYWYPKSIKDYNGNWHKDHSNLASKMAAEKVMTHSWPVEAAIKLVTNPFDFMLRYKAVGGSKLYIGDQKQLKTVRYYVSTKGEPMKKVSPPKGEVGQYKRKNKLTDKYFKSVIEEIGKDAWDERIHTKNKSKYEIVETSIQSGWKVKQCNVASDFTWEDVDWKFYIEEAKKILIGSK